MKNSQAQHRRGFSLLELTVTVAILAMVSTATMGLVRTSYTAWNRHDDDQTQRREALALLKHLSRHIRQARAVLDISASSDTSGNLSLLMSDGATYVWEHNSVNKEVTFGIGTASSLLATGIEELSFQGLGADGTTEVTDVGLVHSVTPTVSFDLVRPASTDTETNSCRAWLRSW